MCIFQSFLTYNVADFKHLFAYATLRFVKRCISCRNSFASYLSRMVMISKGFKWHCGSVGIDVNEFVKLLFAGVWWAVFDHFFGSVNYSWVFTDYWYQYQLIIGALMIILGGKSVFFLGFAFLLVPVENLLWKLAQIFIGLDDLPVMQSIV